MSFSFIDHDLEHFESQGLRRHLREVSSPQAREIILNGQKVLNFCSNNYLGLADDERIKQAAIDGMNTYGFGSGASRLVCGNTSAHEQLERDLAQFKGTDACLLFSSGYMANTGVIPALVGRGDIVFCDKLNHASIIDGILLSRAELKRYAHVDMQALEEGLKNASAFKKKLIVTDSVFSMDGDVAPLQSIMELARQYDAMVMVDEAHAFGVLGPNGGGLVEEKELVDVTNSFIPSTENHAHEGMDEWFSGGIPPDSPKEGKARLKGTPSVRAWGSFIQMGTLSKAAGCFGAYVCGSRQLREYLINKSRSFIYTTAMPSALAQAASAAIAIIKNEPQRRERLKSNADYLRSSLQAMGLDTLNSSTPIIPIILNDSQRAVEVSKKLLGKGIFVSAIRPPTVPVSTARLRVTVMATHTQADLDYFLQTIKGVL